MDLGPRIQELLQRADLEGEDEATTPSEWSRGSGGSTLSTAKVAQSKQRLVTTLTDRELEILDPFFLTMNSVE